MQLRHSFKSVTTKGSAILNFLLKKLNGITESFRRKRVEKITLKYSHKINEYIKQSNNETI